MSNIMLGLKREVWIIIDVWVSLKPKKPPRLCPQDNLRWGTEVVTMLTSNNFHIDDIYIFWLGTITKARKPKEEICQHV